MHLTNTSDIIVIFLNFNTIFTVCESANQIIILLIYLDMSDYRHEVCNREILTNFYANMTAVPHKHMLCLHRLLPVVSLALI